MSDKKWGQIRCDLTSRFALYTYATSGITSWAILSPSSFSATSRSYWACRFIHVCADMPNKKMHPCLRRHAEQEDERWGQVYKRCTLTTVPNDSSYRREVHSEIIGELLVRISTRRVSRRNGRISVMCMTLNFR